MRDITLRDHPRAHHIQRIVYAKDQARIAITRATNHQRIKAFRDHFRHQQRIRITGIRVSAGESTATCGIRMTIFYHHIIRRQMDSITRHLVRTRVMKIFFRRAGADFRGFNQRRRFAQLTFIISGEKCPPQPRPHCVAQEIEILHAFRIRQRLVTGINIGIVINRRHRRQIVFQYCFRQCIEGGK